MPAERRPHLTRFIGRQRELGELRRLLDRSRLLTLSGPGGCGKTRLAAALADRVAEQYPGGAAWVDFAAVADAALVARTVARAVRVPEQPEHAAAEALTAFLRDQQLLLILDNCEHLVTACAGLVDGLLAACPRLDILATSREPLALPGEQVYPVPGLALPEAGHGRAGPLPAAALAALRRSEAVALFLDRAAALVPGFALTAANAPAIAQICRRLDGLPLAIELAAARVNVLAPGQIATRLDDQFGLLVSEKRAGVPARHLTLRAAVDWSYDLLAPAEQALLRRLSVFAGGCALSGAAAMADTGDVLPTLTALVAKSLVVAETGAGGDARYAMLETIRHYALEKLQAAGEQAAARDRHLRYYVSRVEAAEPKLKGEYQQLWLNWLEREVDNIRAALAWALESAQIEAGLRVAVPLYQFWTIRDYRAEGLRWYQRLLRRAGPAVAPAARANALAYASLMAGFAGQTERQLRYAREGVDLGEQAGAAGRGALAAALGAYAFAARKAGDHRRSLDLGLRQIELQRALGDGHMLGLSLAYYSFMATSLEEYDLAQQMLDEGLPLLRAAGDPYRIAMALNYQGDLARCEEDYPRAVAAYAESIAILEEIEATRDLASAYHNQGHAYLQLGQIERARDLFRESMAIHREQRNDLGSAECLLGFAALALAGGMKKAAARLLAAAAALGGRHGTAEWAATRLAYQRLLERARAALSAGVLRDEQLAGQTLSLAEAVAFAEETAARGAAAQAARAKLDDLTPRERQVAALVAQAKSNDDIAQELVISKRTVETHVSRILGKLGFESRAQIVRWALEAEPAESGK